MVCKEAIRLFWHASAITSEACFHMSDRNIQFGCGQCSSEGRICISVNDRDLGLLFFENPLAPLKHPSSLDSMRTRSCSQVVIRFGESKLFKKDSIHEIIVVLACVDQNFSYAFFGTEPNRS